MGRIWEQLRFLTPGWTDLVEILIVAFLLYKVLLVIQRTRAMQIMLGVALLAFTYGLARLLDLILIRRLLEAGFAYGAIAALVVFQPELRSALARLGRSRMIRVFQPLEDGRAAEEVVEAALRLARARHGAIIAIERDVGLEEYAETGFDFLECTHNSRSLSLISLDDVKLQHLAIFTRLITIFFFTHYT